MSDFSLLLKPLSPLELLVLYKMTQRELLLRDITVFFVVFNALWQIKKIQEIAIMQVLLGCF